MNTNYEMNLHEYALNCMANALSGIGIKIDASKNLSDEVNAAWNRLNEEQQKTAAMAFTKAVL